MERRSEEQQRSARSEIGSKVDQVTENVKSKAGEVFADAKSAAMENADTRKQHVASYVEGLAEAANKSADTLKQQGRNRSAAYVANAADRVSTLADRMADKSASELLGEAEEFARERPALVFGAAAVIGFGLVRFLRSSEQSGYREDDSYQSSHTSRQYGASTN